MPDAVEGPALIIVSAVATIRYTAGEFVGQSPTNKRPKRLSSLMPKRQIAGCGHDFLPVSDVSAAAIIRYTGLKFEGQRPTNKKSQKGYRNRRQKRQIAGCGHHFLPVLIVVSGAIIIRYTGLKFEGQRPTNKKSQQAHATDANTTTCRMRQRFAKGARIATDASTINCIPRRQQQLAERTD